MSAPVALPRIGFIGVGAMGEPMALRLLASGALLAAHDLDADAVARLAAQGAKPADSPASAARDAALLVLMVHDAAQIERVLWGANGAAAALPRGSTVWLGSTVSPAWVCQLGDRLAAERLELVDGPVSGGVTGARSGALTVMASGSAHALETAWPAMQACAAQVLRVGPLGAGSTFKMINQLLTAAHLALTAEALALGREAGIDLELLVDVVRHSAGNSVMFDKRAPRMVAGDHEAQATLKTFMKDLDIALDAARALRVPLPLASAAQAVYARAAALGRAEDSDTQLLRAYAGADATP